MHILHSLIATLLVLGLSALPFAERAIMDPVGSDTLVLRAPEDSSDVFKDAIHAYESANFEHAISLFEGIATDSSQDRVLRRDAWHYLGRVYLAMRDGEEARTALEQMADFEPPRITIDPDIEPPNLLRLYYDVYKDREGSYAGLQEQGKTTIAVIDFDNQSIDDHERLEPLSKGFASLLINQLNGTTDLKVVERERIQWLLSELDLQQKTGRIDPESAVRAGKLLGVHMVMMGSFMKFGKQMSLNARLVDVETGEILMTDQVQGKAEDFFKLADRLSLSVVKSINVKAEENAFGGRFEETSSLDALLSYSEGLTQLELENYRHAYEKFLEALEYDPSYKRALLKARSLEPFLQVNAG